MNYTRLPYTTQSGLVLTSTGDGQGGCKWSAVGLSDTKDYAVSGVLAVASGALNYLPPFIYQQVATLISVTGMVRAGSLTLDIEQNGSAIGGLTALAFDTTMATYTPTDATPVSVLDYFAPVIDSVSTADGLSLTFLFAVPL